MHSVSASDLVSGALKSTLARAQKNYDFSSESTKAKEKINRNKGFHNLEGDSGREKDFSYCNIAVKSNKLQFVTSGYQLSSFIETIRSKYECLNPSKTSLKANHSIKAKQLKPKFLKLKGKSTLSECTKNATICPVANGAGQQIRDKLSSKDNNIQTKQKSDSIFPGKEIFEQLKQRRKEARRKKKEAQKLARLEKLKAVEPSLFDPDIVARKSLLNLKNRNHLLINKSSLPYNNRKMKEAVATSTNIVNGLSTSTTNQLSQPKIVLYERSKVVPGWKNKHPIGCGLINLGNSCYMNASLQALFHTPAFVNWLLDDTEHQQKCRSSGQTCIICAMYSVLTESINHSHQCIRPVQVHSKLKVICKHFTHGRQEDAHEFLRYLLESMERSYLAAINCLRLDNRSKETTPLGQIFGGYLRTEVTCLKCNFISTTFQPLAELQLDIRHFTTLEDSIQNHFKKERLDNNDYKCEKCHTISPATKQFSLEIPPIVLCLQLKRFTLYGNKIAKPIHCNRSLNLTRYLHKSHHEIGESKYRLVALVTHMGSSPNCGHYTAIAEAANGNFYQFDDSFVKQVSVQTALNTDAYVIIYELDRKQNQMGSTSSSSNSNYIGKPATITNSFQNAAPAITVNGNTSTLPRHDSPHPAPKRFTVPFLQSPVSANSALRNATMGSPSVPNGTPKINTLNSFSTSNKQLTSNGSGNNSVSAWKNMSNPVATSTLPAATQTSLLSEQQCGIKRKLEDVLGKREQIKIDIKQPRLVTPIISKTDTPTSISEKTNGNVCQPVSSTSNWKVIANEIKSQAFTEKQSENFRKSVSKSGGYSSDPETKLNNNSRHVDIHRAKSVERLCHSQPNKTDISLQNHKEYNTTLVKPPEKMRKSPVLEAVTNTKINVSVQNGKSKFKDDTPPTTVHSNGYVKNGDRGDHTVSKLRPASSLSLVGEAYSSSASASENSSDERHKSKSNKHKKKTKRSKSKRRKKKHHKKRSSSSGSSSSSSESESESSKKNKNGAFKVMDQREDKNNKSGNKHKSRNGFNHDALRSSPTTSTDVSEDGNRKPSLYNGCTEGGLSPGIARSISEERERDRRKNRNPSRSRSPDRKVARKDQERFDTSKLVPRDRQISSWSGTESSLSKSIDIDRKAMSRKNADELFDEELDAARAKKVRKSLSPTRNNDSGSSVNKFQSYEDKKKNIADWNKVLDGYSSNFKPKYSDKSYGKGGGDYQNQRGSYRSGNSYGSGYSGSNNFHRNNFRSGKGGRGSFGRNRHSGSTGFHHNSFRRDNRDRRPS